MDENSTNTEPNQGLSTALSYYSLYKTKPDSTPCLQKIFESTLNTQQTQQHQHQPTTTQFQPWTKDEWTESCTHHAETKLQQNQSICSDLSTKNCSSNDTIINKMEYLAPKKWDLFYKRNKTNFYKNRHYLEKAFPLDFDEGLYDSDKVLVEIGSGSGANVLPLIERGVRLKIFCFDFSKVAVDLLNEHPLFQPACQEGRAEARVWDITTPSDQNPNADITMLLFCLSAITPTKMLQAVQNISSTLKPGGVVLFRDYGRYDEAQMKLGASKGKRISDNFYLKHDGTRCYYFDLEDVCVLFEGAGLDILELGYIQRLYFNRGTGMYRRRVWVQGRFRKPL